MCKWAKIKAADVRQYINGSRKKDYGHRLFAVLLL